MEIYALAIETKFGAQAYACATYQEAEEVVYQELFEHGRLPADVEFPDKSEGIFTWLQSRDAGHFYVTINKQELKIPALTECRAALGNLLHQVYQMQGLFADSDGTIREAISDAEKALKVA